MQKCDQVCSFSTSFYFQSYKKYLEKKKKCMEISESITDLP